MPINSQYLRISVTNKCNLSCYFCHNEGQSIEKSSYELTKKDIIFLVDSAQKIGFSKIKLTGGEPTLRRDIFEIINCISKYNFDDFSIITNGVSLFKIAEQLKSSGLPRLNVTLQTLNKDTFINNINPDINKLDSIIKGIDKAISIGYTDIKLNFIYHSRNSEFDFIKICHFAAERNLVIVLLPLLLINPKSTDYIVELDSLYKMLQKLGIVAEKLVYDNEGISRRLIQLKSGATVLLRMNELSDIFPYYSCSNCNLKPECREGIFPMRITADGFIIPCLPEGISRIDIREVIINRNVEQFNKTFEYLRNK